MVDQASDKQVEVARAAAIVAVVAEIESSKSRVAGGPVPGASGRDAWKMAGRAERLGIGGKY